MAIINYVGKLSTENAQDFRFDLILINLCGCNFKLIHRKHNVLFRFEM